MLRVENLTYRIGPRVLLDGANAAINAGHRVGFVGRNGTGKTTVLKLITGGLQPDGGGVDRGGIHRTALRHASSQQHVTQSGTRPSGVADRANAPFQPFHAHRHAWT